jgi:hypothetical protein
MGRALDRLLTVALGATFVAPYKRINEHGDVEDVDGYWIGLKSNMRVEVTDPATGDKIKGRIVAIRGKGPSVMGNPPPGPRMVEVEITHPESIQKYGPGRIRVPETQLRPILMRPAPPAVPRQFSEGAGISLEEARAMGRARARMRVNKWDAP